MNNSPIRILFIHHSAAWGGAAGCLITLITHLDKKKYAPEVLLLKESEISDKLDESEIRYSIAKSFFYRKIYRFFAHSEAGYIEWYNLIGLLQHLFSWLLSRYYFANRELDKHEYDIVHLNSSALTDWLAPAAKKSRVVIHVREPFRKGEFDILHEFFRKQIIKYADKIIAISEDNSKRLSIPAKTEVIYDFCPARNSFPPLESYSSKRVLYLGGSSTSKGFYTIVKALDFINKDVKILFAGKYSFIEKPGLSFKAVKFHLSKSKIRNDAINKILKHPNAEMVGMTYNVPYYLDQVCCLVSPFHVPHFSFPVIEANMHKKAAIGSDVDGMDEIIQDGTNGIIFRKDDPSSLAKAINYITSNTSQALAYGEKGYSIAQKKYNPTNVAKFEKIYDHLFTAQE